MKDRLAKAIANTLYASVGVVAFTGKKLAEGYDTVVEEGRIFVDDVREHYQAKRNPTDDAEYYHKDNDPYYADTEPNAV